MDEVIVAVFENPEHAQAALSDLRKAEVPETAISTHAGTGAVHAAEGGRTDVPGRDRGFWSSLFGGEPDHDHSVYDRTLERGGTVVTVRAPAHLIVPVMEILDRHHPVDIDERAATFGSSQNATAPVASGARTAGAPVSDTLGRDNVIQLSEEELSVGKRLVNRGTTRVRRFTVEKPVEEQVTLHDETVVVERRPVTGQRTADASFSEKFIEMTETIEEPVVSKTARVVEEVAVRKQETDRVETVRDTVRREDVEIEKLPAGSPPKI